MSNIGTRRLKKVYLELSNTFIYKRIALALGASLARSGFEVFTVNPNAFNVEMFRTFLATTEDSIYISNSVNNIIQHRINNSEEFFFEIFKGPVIFLHQDAILGGSQIIDGIAKLKGWLRIAQRSGHLCIDPIDVSHLQSIGIGNAHLVTHATEIARREPLLNEFCYQSSFVGHVVPSGYYSINPSAKTQTLIDKALHIRKSSFASPISPLIVEHTDDVLEGVGSTTDKNLLAVMYAQWFRSRITDQSLTLRGWVLEECNASKLDVFGGDPAPLHGLERNLKISRDCVYYHASVYDPEEVSDIYNSSQISINISSLQFDHALVNRFHDVTMSGGLCITDAKPGLVELTPLHSEISFHNLTELQERIHYFSQPKNNHIRQKLVQQLQADIMKNSGYDRLVGSIENALSELI